MTPRKGAGRQDKVPPVAELRPIAQGSKTSDDRRWAYLAFRRLSIYVTWVLLHTGVTPNQVTVASLAIAAGGLVLVGAPAPGVAIAGLALLLLYHVLDRVDGEVARYRETYSLYGIYLDNAGHYVTGAGLLIAATYRVAPFAAEPQTIWLAGSIGAIAVVLTRVEKHSAFQLFSQYVMDQPGLLETVRHETGFLTREAARADRSETGDKTRRSMSVGSFVRDVMLATTTFPVTTVILMLAFTLEAIMESTAISLAILMAVVALQVIVYVGVEFANLTQNLAAESRRLAYLAGLESNDPEDEAG